MSRIEFVRTHYRHWAAHSGYRALVPALRDCARFERVEERLIQPLDEGETPRNIVGHDVVMPWYSPASHRAEIELAQRAYAEPTLIHFMDGEHDFYYSARLEAHTGARLIATYHQPPSILEALGLLGDERQLHSLDRAIVLCEEQREHLARSMAAERISVIPHGVDVDHYRPGEPRDRAGRALNLLCVGFWLRDLDLLAECMERLGPGTDVRLHLVGLHAGAARGAVADETLARLCALHSAIVHPMLSDPSLLRLYRECDLLALPLRAATANNALLEAASCGLPIVTTDLPATREYLGDEGALFAPRGDAGGFIASLDAALGDADWRRRAGGALRARMVDRFDWKKIARRHAELYAGVLEEPAARSRRRTGGKRARRAMCTVITSDYVPQALALASSIADHGDADFFALVTNHEHAPGEIERVNALLGDRMTLIDLSELDPTTPDYDCSDAVRWALKAPLILHLLRHRGYDRVLFVDSDLCFFEDYGFLFDRLEESSILLTPHWRTLDPTVDENQFRCNFLHGLYNAGFVGASKAGIPALRWWAEACLYRCDKGMTEGFYVDQRYLDVLPVYFDGVEVIGDVGCNVAEWNRERVLREQVGEKGFAQTRPVVFAHMSDLTLLEIGAGNDRSLTAYAREYAGRMQQAEADAIREGLQLRERISEDAEPATGATAGEGTLEAELLTVVDSDTLSQLSLLIASIERHWPEAKRLRICCADRDALLALEAARLPDFADAFHWSALAAYALEKDHARDAADQARFTRQCRAFALQQAVREASGPVLFVEPGTVFGERPDALFARFAAGGGPLAIPRVHSGRPREHFERCDFRLGLADRSSAPFLEFWRMQLCKRREWDRIPLPERRSDWPVHRLREGFAVLGIEGGVAPASSEPILFVECAGAELPEALADLAASRPIPAGSGAELLASLAAQPPDLVARAALNQGGDIRNFGQQHGFRKDGNLTPLLAAYLLYLIAAMHRRQGDVTRARPILRVLAKTDHPLPDLYRAKVHDHLAQIALDAERADEAAAHLAIALRYVPGSAALRASKRDADQKAAGRQHAGSRMAPRDPDPPSPSISAAH